MACQKLTDVGVGMGVGVCVSASVLACAWTVICVCAHVPAHSYMPQCARRSEDSPGYWSLPFTVFQTALPGQPLELFPFPSPSVPARAPGRLMLSTWLDLGSGKFELRSSCLGGKPFHLPSCLPSPYFVL